MQLEDLYTLDGWYKQRGLAPVPHNLYPPYGLMADGLAAGFVMMTDTPLAFGEYFITPAKCDRFQRHAAIHKIGNALEDYARAHGARFMMYATKNPRIRGYLKEHGVSQVTKMEMYAKEL